MHLYPADTEARRDIVGRIVAEEIEYLLPVHCTGILAICDLRNLKGENCLPAGAGDKYVF
jgi:7,8-dihydropterin-6-yl-methyl-4-(beta-D-ribofuranosyl)aminobenzene 5'-phosphate synthase